MKKGRLLLAIIIVSIFSVTSVFALIMASSWTDYITLKNSASIESNPITTSGVNLAAQVDKDKAQSISYAYDSKGQPYIKMKFTLYKKGLFTYSQSGPAYSVSIYSGGLVGGIWTNQATGTYKAKYTMEDGAVSGLYAVFREIYE